MRKNLVLTMDILQEECAELISAISKIKRFGIDSVNPKTGVTNLENLKQEMSDVVAMISCIAISMNIDVDEIAHGSDAKVEKVLKYHPELTNEDWT